MSWCYSTDDERFQGDFRTAEDAAGEAFEENEEFESVLVGETRDPLEWMTPENIGERCFEDMCDRLGDEVGDASEFFTLTRDQQRELGATILKWVADHGGFRCFGVRNISTIRRDELAAREGVGK